jgi:hypothetical protein
MRAPEDCSAKVRGSIDNMRNSIYELNDTGSPDR